MMHTHLGLWKRLMMEWPMSSYPELMMATLHALHADRGRVLEVGSGVGNTTQHLHQWCDADRFVWSDRDAGLVMRGRWSGTGVIFDFDKDPPTHAYSDNQRGAMALYCAADLPEADDDDALGRFDAIVATNALHCSADPKAALSRLRHMLNPHGRLYLAEGSNPTRLDGTPWALDMLFTAFDGWWDRSGFRTRWEWLALMEEAGFPHLGFTTLRAAEDDLGGIVWADTGRADT